MCRLLAYCGRPVLLETQVVAPERSLLVQAREARESPTPVNADGCGIGWYGEREEPGLYRGVLPAWSDPNWASLAAQVRSPLFLAHIRAATAGEVSLANCHPFRVGRHLFMHNGQVGGFGRIRGRIEALVHPELAGERHGSTDSEALFLAALSAGLAERPVAAMAETLGRVKAFAGSGEGPSVRLAAVAAGGRRLVVFRYADDGPPPTLYVCRTPEGVVVASEPTTECRGGWTAVPESTALLIDGSGLVEAESFGPRRRRRRA